MAMDEQRKRRTLILKPRRVAVRRDRHRPVLAIIGNGAAGDGPRPIRIMGERVAIGVIGDGRAADRAIEQALSGNNCSVRSVLNHTEVFPIILPHGVEGITRPCRRQRVFEFIRDIQHRRFLLIAGKVKPAKAIRQQNQLFDAEDVGAVLVFNHTADRGPMLVDTDHPVEGNHHEEVITSLSSRHDAGRDELYAVHRDKAENDVPP